jgi:hypothetical protein
LRSWWASTTRVSPEAIFGSHCVLERIAAIAREHAAGNQRLGQGLQHDAAAQLLHDHHAFDRAHAHAAIGLAEMYRPAQAQFGQFVVGRAVETARLATALRRRSKS